MHQFFSFLFEYQSSNQILFGDLITLFTNNTRPLKETEITYYFFVSFYQFKFELRNQNQQRIEDEI